MAAPILSTPAEYILEDATPTSVQSTESRLSREQLYVQYEIKRTVDEIRAGSWKRIALQFPDDMLVDAPRVFQHLQEELNNHNKKSSTIETLATEVATTQIADNNTNSATVDETLCILADTSYGACCVDEVAAEHTDADVVVHYGRSCLSPTARLPVIYVFTSKPADVETMVTSFKKIHGDKSESVCLMADIPYGHVLPELSQRLRQEGYSHIFQTEIVRDPSALLPNRTVPLEVKEDPEKLKEWSIFHVSSPPSSLLLILSSRVHRIHIFPTDSSETSDSALQASTSQLLRRRYGLITRLSTESTFGILINTLSVSNYMQALQHCQDIIKRAGKKSYVFVVGKVNAAKVANFSEIGGWVVIGCWESSLLESKDFYRPIITPFELEATLTDDDERVWSGEWIGDFSTLLGRDKKEFKNNKPRNERVQPDAEDNGSWEDRSSDDEPPEFDLRAGKYVSHSRPMGRMKKTGALEGGTEKTSNSTPASSALIQQVKGDITSINGVISPGAEFLRSKRTWQGLGSDYEIEYQRDAEGKIQGAATMEEGRAGVAKGYSVGADSTKS